MRAASVIFGCVLFLGCAGVEMKPGEQSYDRRGMPPGPGLFSGEQGEFVLYRRQQPAEDEKKKGGRRD